MVVPDPLQELEAGILAFVENKVEQDCGHSLALQQLPGFGSRGGHRGPVAKVLKVDPQLLLHRDLVLDHQNR
ncbi:MAG: hypothetical protein PVS3B2_20870 [Candidatus Dormibacteraceae bacterium]